MRKPLTPISLFRMVATRAISARNCGLHSSGFVDFDKYISLRRFVASLLPPEALEEDGMQIMMLSLPPDGWCNSHTEHLCFINV